MNFFAKIKQKIAKQRRIKWILKEYEKTIFLLSPDNFVDRNILFEGGYENFQRDFFYSCLRKYNCEVLLDIGSNFGLYSLTAAKNIDNLKEVHSFECDKRNYSHLWANIRLNDLYNKITPHFLAVGESSREVNFVQASEKNTGTSRIDKSGEVTVNQVSLDGYLDVRSRAGVKIDVEGAELNVLLGMKAWLSSDLLKVIQIEIFEHNFEKVVNLLEIYGFKKTAKFEFDYIFEKL